MTKNYREINIKLVIECKKYIIQYANKCNELLHIYLINI